MNFSDRFFIVYTVFGALLVLTGHTVTGSIMLGGYALILLGLQFEKELRNRK